jgi:cystathionine gamma-lyase
MTPISVSTTFIQKSPGVFQGYDYIRAGNPTRQAYEDCIASLEGAKHGFALSSGCAATAMIMHLLKAGDHVVAGDDMYGGTFRLFDKVYKHMGLEFSYTDLTNVQNLEKVVQKNTKLIWLETPTNPTMKLVDINAVAQFAKVKGITTVVDNTFMSPYFQNPIALGADVVMHSATKYLGGHSDVLGGVVVTDRADLAEKFQFLLKSIGAVASPFDSYMALRSLKTLPLRMEAHQKNALKVAQYLEEHKKIEKVLYPGLKSHPQHELAKKQASGFSGMLSVYLKGGLPESRSFLEKLKLFALAESLGGVESLIEHPAIMTHASIPAENRKALGIADNFIRISVGIENIEDLLADLNQALG